MSFGKFLMATAFAVVVAASPVWGGNQSSSSSGSSRPSTSSYSAPSTSYSKPPAPAPSVNSNSGYTKPNVAQAPVVNNNSTGYSKPPQATPQAAPPVANNSTGYSKPPAPTANTNSGYSKPGSSPGTYDSTKMATPKAAVAPASVMATASSKQMSADSLKKYQAERNGYKQPPVALNTQDVRSNPTMNHYRNSYNGNFDTYMARRQQYSTTYYSRYPDVVVINSNMRPNYGIYDSGFLTGMVLGAVGTSMIQNAMWMAAHQNQPWYGAYRADLERQAQNNVELRNKLAQMDAEISRLKEQNAVKQDVGFDLPPGVPAEMAISPEAVIADTPDKSDNSTSVVKIIVMIVIGGLVIFVCVFYFVTKR